MTRDEAIFYIESYKMRLVNSVSNGLDKDIEAFNMAIKALEQEPCNTDTCKIVKAYMNEWDKPNNSDAISRQAVLDIDFKRIILTTAKPAETIEQKVKALPPATPKPKTGYWIKWYEQREDDSCIEYTLRCKCSECGKEYDPYSSQFIKYCSECGVKMVEPRESEDKDV